MTKPAESNQAKTNAIEVEFAVPVEISREQMNRLADVLVDIVRANVPEGMVHWLAGSGSKPMWSDADFAFDPTLQGGRSGDVSGEPTFDDSILYFTSACREKTTP